MDVQRRQDMGWLCRTWGEDNMHAGGEDVYASGLKCVREGERYGVKTTCMQVGERSRPWRVVLRLQGCA